MLESHHKIFRPINAYNDLSCSSPFSILFLVNDTSRRLQKRKGGGGGVASQSYIQSLPSSHCVCFETLLLTKTRH